MPYADKEKDRTWHREWMRRYRLSHRNTLEIPTADLTVTPIENVTPVTPKRMFVHRNLVTPLTKERQTSRKGFNE